MQTKTLARNDLITQSSSISLSIPDKIDDPSSSQVDSSKVEGSLLPNKLSLTTSEGVLAIIGVRPQMQLGRRSGLEAIDSEAEEVGKWSALCRRMTPPW